MQNYTNLKTRCRKYRAEINRLIQENSDFREICDDFEAIADKLAFWRNQPEVSIKLLEEYETLADGLETEILDFIKNNKTG